MQTGRQKLYLWTFILLVLVLISLPYVYAYLHSGTDYTFSGFLLNPADGNSYLAKMRQGYRGSWTFTLPYTAEPGAGTFMFTFYLALGHLAQRFHLSIPLTFHLARLLGAVLLLLALHHFCERVFAGEVRLKWTAFVLAALGSGLGWLALPFAKDITADLWVAEGYPFLSMYANPHFPLGLALILWLVTPRWGAVGVREAVLLFLAALVLGMAMPFGVPLVLLAWGGVLLWQFAAREDWKPTFRRMLWIGLGGAPVLLYFVYVANTHPVLQGWNAQNLTTSPPFWDVLISFSPALLLAVPGVWYAWKHGTWEQKLVVSWGVLCLLLLYFPFSLQRRFITGFYVPLACLAVLGVKQLAGERARAWRILVTLWAVLAIPTNLVLIATGVFAAQTHDLNVYLTRDEAAALDWLADNIDEGALVLAGPQIGAYIPAYMDGRVIYGHPFETVDAEMQEAVVTGFYAGRETGGRLAVFLQEQGVDYVFYGPRERALGELAQPEGWRPAFESQGVIIYAPAE
jgi:hypothetical protein